MSEKHLNDQLKHFYQDQEPDKDRLEQLLAMAEESNTNAINTSSNTLAKFSIPKVFAVAASFMLIIALSLTLLPSGLFGTKDLAMLVSQEIALNHNKQLAVEYSTDSYAALRDLMKKLDFTPTKPSRPDINELAFLGARYCSIQGQLAAQIKLKDKNGRIQTLYQTQLNDSLKTLTDKEFYVDGVKIKHWQENGLFFGLATSADN